MPASSTYTCVYLVPTTPFLEQQSRASFSKGAKPPFLGTKLPERPIILRQLLPHCIPPGFFPLVLFRSGYTHANTAAVARREAAGWSKERAVRITRLSVSHRAKRKKPISKRLWSLYFLAFQRGEETGGRGGSLSYFLSRLSAMVEYP